MNGTESIDEGRLLLWTLNQTPLPFVLVENVSPAGALTQ